MGRPWQIFAAPGEETEELPIPPSPWHIERWARLPQEHWLLMLNFAKQYNQQYAERLRYLSAARDGNKEDEVYASKEELAELVVFLEQLSFYILQSEPLISFATEEILDEYDNPEHIRMLQAVIAVFKESIRQEKPFCAWLD